MALPELLFLLLAASVQALPFACNVTTLAGLRGFDESTDGNSSA